MALVEELADPRVPVSAACAALGVSRASLYRATRPPVPAGLAAPCRRAPPSRKLSDTERSTIIDVLHSPEFADQPPAEVYGRLLSGGKYLASPRTFYRILQSLGETKERRNQRLPRVYEAPRLTATAPNQVWTWDITKLATLEKGIFLHLYVIIDLFSRYVVRWMVAERECKRLAELLFTEAIAQHGVLPGMTVHSDRGSAMKSDTMALLFAALGIDQSFSRPRVSNDNPHMEAHFKTLKYQPEYPGWFAGAEHARGHLQPFFSWHNDDHQHSGLALFTPADVFFGRVPEFHRVRQDALDRQYALHPERFPNGAPEAAWPPAAVHINPVGASAALVGADMARGAAQPTATGQPANALAT